MRPDLEILTKLVDDVWELVFGTERRPKRKRGEDRRKTDRGNDRRFNKFGEPEEPKRARGKKGRYLADDKSTPNVNEAWVGGKAPKRGKK